MTHYNAKRNIVCIIAIMCCLAAAIAAVLSNAFSISNRDDPAKPSYALLTYSGWSVAEEGDSYRSIELPAYIPTGGKPLQIVNTLPRALENGTCLAFESVNTYVTVRVDGEEIYRNMVEGKQTYSMWNYIYLDAIQAEGRITIDFSGPDSYDVGTLPEIYLGPKTEILLMANDQIRINSQMGITIFFFGIFVLLFSLVSFSDSQYVVDFILLGLVIIVLGLSQALQVVHPTGRSTTWFVSQGIGVSLFGLLPSFYCFYRGVRAEEEVKRRYFITCWSGVGFYFLVYFFRWFGSSLIWPSARIISYLVFEGIYGYCLYCTLCVEKQDSRRYSVLVTISLACLMAGMGLEGFTHLRYTYMKLFHPLMLGALLFSLLHVIAVLLYVFEHIQQQVRIAQELSDSRVRLMINQLKPHFIRNSLATIRVITRHDPQKAYDLLYDFTQYLSYNIDSMRETELTTFGEELRHIHEYTNIEEEHMRHRLRMVYEPGPTDFEIPPLSIEPFVENAVKHGVWPRREGGTVWVGSRETPEGFEITVRDNGVGFDPDNPPPPVLRGHGIGMKYAIERLRTMVNGTVDIQSEKDKGTTVTITIPKIEREGEK